LVIIATLIAADRLSVDDIRNALGLLDAGGVKAGEWQWIDEGSAADLQVDLAGADVAAVRAALERKMGPIDVIVQPVADRAKKALVADMDSTIIGQECIDELADYAGLKAEVADITERAMQGELDFHGALRERVALLKGLREQAIAECLAERVTPNPGAATLVQTMRARGASCLLISGGFTAFAQPVAEKVGFDRVRANVLGTGEGVLTGEVSDPIVDSIVKREGLIALREELGLRRSDVLAIGDGANDRLMIEEAGLGVAYRAKPVLAADADACLDHNRLDALLWAQGIPRAAWINAG
jgi:phosphoserine phosphatase